MAFYDYDPYYQGGFNFTQNLITQNNAIIRETITNSYRALNIRVVERLYESKEMLFNLICREEENIMSEISSFYENIRMEFKADLEKKKKEMDVVMKNKVKQVCRTMYDKQDIEIQKLIKNHNESGITLIENLQKTHEKALKIIEGHTEYVLEETEKRLASTTEETIGLINSVDLNKVVLSAIEKIMEAKVLHVHQHEYEMIDRSVKPCCGPSRSTSMKLNTRTDHNPKCFKQFVKKTLIFDMCPTLDKKLHNACVNIAEEWRKTAKRKRESIKRNADVYKSMFQQNEETVRALRVANSDLESRINKLREEQLCYLSEKNALTNEKDIRDYQEHMKREEFKKNYPRSNSHLDMFFDILEKDYCDYESD